MTAVVVTGSMTPGTFHEWLLIAEPQERTTYHVGYLAADREYQPALSELANLAWNAQLGGFVELTQIRLGDGLYAYLATRTEEIVG